MVNLKKEQLNKLSNRSLSDLKSNQSGQALLLVIVALTIALAVGVSTSLRTLSSVSRVTTTDTASRVLSAAEGGLEHFLSYTTEELETASALCTNLSGDAADCVIDFPAVETDNISARALVMVESYSGDDEDGAYRTTVEQGEFSSVNLRGYSGALDVCWSGNSDVYYTLVAGRDSADWAKGIECPDSGGCMSDVPTTVPSLSDDVGCQSGENGFRIDVPAGHDTFDLEKSLTVVPLNDTIRLTFRPAAGLSFPGLLGYRITSRGELLEDKTVKTTRTISAVRSVPFLPTSFSFGVFADGGIVNGETYYSSDP